MTLKLRHGRLSPFVRKVMICAYEKGIAEKIELEATKVGAVVVNEDLMAINPIGKIPTLTDGNEVVFDSLVIIDYLDHLFPEKPMIPTTYPNRLSALRLNATADGLLVAGVLAKGQAALPAEQQWTEFRDANWAKVESCVASLDRQLDPEAPFQIGHAATAAALGWMDVRASDYDWRAQCPGLAAWFAKASERPSLELTKPVV